MEHKDGIYVLIQTYQLILIFIESLKGFPNDSVGWTNIFCLLENAPMRMWMSRLRSMFASKTEASTTKSCELKIDQSSEENNLWQASLSQMEIDFLFQPCSESKPKEFDFLNKIGVRKDCNKLFRTRFTRAKLSSSLDLPSPESVSFEFTKENSILKKTRQECQSPEIRLITRSSNPNKAPLAEEEDFDAIDQDKRFIYKKMRFVTRDFSPFGWVPPFIQY